MGRVPWLLCLHVLTLLCILSLIHGQCTQFEFPSIKNDSSLAIKPSARLLLPFELDIQNCIFNGTKHVTITVSNQNKGTGIFNVDCMMIIYPNGTCFSFRPECRCGARGQFYLNKTMNANDVTLWKWKVGEGKIVPERKILFVIHRYAPAVKQLTFHSTTDNASLTYPLEPSTSVDIICKYDKGYPEASSVVLKNSKGMTINPTASLEDEQGELSTARFRMQNVGCDDMGKISCEIPRADKNLTTTLLVKCPPRYTEEVVKIFPGIEGNPMELSFQLYTHTKEITGCHVTKVSQGHSEDLGHSKTHTDETASRECHQFASALRVNGTLPYAMLDMQLARVTPEHNGTWILTISNGAGSADVTFTLNVIGVMSAVSALIMYALIGIVGFLVVVIITGFVVFVVNIKKKRQYKRAALRTRDAGTHDDDLQDRRSGSHFYEDIPDEAQLGAPRGYHHGQGQIPQHRGSPAPPPRPADSQSDGYLHPVNDVSPRRVNQPAGTNAASAGPYDSLEMSDVGLRSPYSQLGM